MNECFTVLYLFCDLNVIVRHKTSSLINPFNILFCSLNLTEGGGRGKTDVAHYVSHAIVGSVGNITENHKCGLLILH